jgi:hypothetical protein
LSADGWRARVDLYVELPNGQEAFIEVKTSESPPTSPTEDLSPNQEAVYPAVSARGGVPYGPNAARAGLVPGIPIGPTPVRGLSAVALVALVGAAVMDSGVRLAESTLREPLELIGFRKRGPGIFTITLADGVLGWLGLNYANRHRPEGHVAIHPVIGVRHQAVERLIARLCREEFHEYLPPTISVPIGYVMPASRDMIWEFSDQRKMIAETDFIAAVSITGYHL